MTRLTQSEAGAEPYVSIVSPVYGCERSLQRLLDGVVASMEGITNDFEVILVDDASPDGAWRTIETLARSRPWLRGIRLSRNFGQHAAISAGIESARGRWVVVMDCDLQDPPSSIPILYRAAIETGSDAVFARRLDRQDKMAKRFASWLFYRCLAWLTGVPQDESTANFGIFSRQIIDVVVAMPERDRAFPLLVRWAGFRVDTVDVRHSARAEGKSSYSFSMMLRLATQIALGYSDKPLRMVAVGGIVFSFLSIIMVLVTVGVFIQGSITVAGYTSLVASIWLLGGLTLLSLGVVGLYIGQVFRNVQGRPAFIIAQTVGTGDSLPGRSTP